MTPADWPRQAISAAIVLYFGWAVFAHWSEGLEQTVTNLIMMVVGYWLGSSKNSTDNAKGARDAVDLAREMNSGPQPVVVVNEPTEPVPTAEGRPKP